MIPAGLNSTFCAFSEHLTLLPAPVPQVYRDKEGKIVDKEAYIEGKKKKKKVEYDAEANLEWGGGLKQRQDREAAQRAMAEEASKPFAR